MQRQALVPTTEERAIPRNNVGVLFEAFREAFLGPHKVERLVYVRGRPTFTVERLVPADTLAEGGEGLPDFLTPFQMIRQHADLEIQEPIGAPLEAISRAVQSLTSRGLKLTMFVCESKDVVRAWLGRDLRIEDIWQVPLHEDPDAHESGVFVVGSKEGVLIRDIEAAILCRLDPGVS